ncbi:hypothetical protein CSC66_09015 [Pseudoxanthomonas kaohsiungensis]|nr:hypothetical protein CSC66_09015 [Pseudoxanthomonas kaohsiungensis]
MADFRKRLDALNRKGERFGVPLVTVLSDTVERYRALTESNEHGTMHWLERVWGTASYGDRIVHMHEIELEYPIIKLGNWQVMAQLEASPTGALAFAASRDPQDMAEIMARAGKPICCEHCNAQRNRKLGFVLKDTQSGQYKEVGSTCVEDFTGVDPAQALFLAKMATFVREEEFDPFKTAVPFGAARTPVRDYLINTLFLVEKFGFVSAARASERMEAPTYKLAESMGWYFKKGQQARDEFDQSRERLGQMADGIVQWYAEHEPQETYAMTVKALLAADSLKSEARHLAYVAGAVPGYLRMLNLQRNVTGGEQVSTHQGVPGEAMKRPLAVLRVVATDTSWGMQYRVVMKDASGNEFCWKTATPPSELQKLESGGRPFAASFKVKEHRMFNDTPVTDVTHLKFGGWLESLAPAAAIEPEPEEAACSMAP